ncbi:MAG TPA: hypothetical protein VN809_01045 [Telmatospirillum sp.]|nr:hypothetical protein [Telmatospirillum sp.]
MVRFIVVLFCLAWPFAAPLSVTAAESGLSDDRGPPPWRIIGKNEQTVSSRCIGRPETAVCAVETFLACFQWVRLDLCRMVDDEAEQYASVFKDPGDPAKYLAYRIVTERSVASSPDRETEIVIEQQEMASGQVIGASAGTSSGFKLRRQSTGAWKVIGWDDLE